MTYPFRALLDFALPERCPSCGALVNAAAPSGQGGGAFCQDCWTKLDFFGGPACAQCDLPLPHGSMDDACCAACLGSPPRLNGIKAAVAYGDIARHVALRLKYGGRIGLARTIAAQLARHLNAMPADAVLVPVPLHWTRLWQRSFNHSVLIAREMERMSGHRLLPDTLRRIRRTTPLGGLSGKERRAMVAGAFTLHQKSADQIYGRHILLVDDVYTSGATTDACITVLKKGGASAVTIFCWARVLPQGVGGRSSLLIC
jgi:ComF family protein